MRVFRLLAPLFLACQFLGAADKPHGYQLSQLSLYQPTEVVQERMPDVKQISGYAKKLDEVCAEYFAKTETPETLQLVVALKPGKRSRVWLISSVLPADNKSRVDLVKKLEAVDPPDPHGGSFVFSLTGEIAGGDGKKPDGKSPPIPQEWEDAAKTLTPPIAMPDGFLSVVWPDETPPVAKRESITHIKAPPGFTVQKLKELHGEILKPEGWFFETMAVPSALVYRISKEDPSEGKGYITGCTINIVPKISTREKHLKATEFAKQYLQSYEKQATMVDQDPPQQENDFERYSMTFDRRMALMGQERDARVGVTVFASDKLDLLVVMLFGCPREDWEANRKLYFTIRKTIILVGPQDEATK